MVRHAWLVAGCLGQLGCGDAAPPPAAPTTSSIVAGVLSDFVPGVDIARVRVITRANGAPLGDRVLRVGEQGPTALAFPMEVRLPELPFGTRVDVRLEAYETMQSEEVALVVREGATDIVAGPPRLLRMRLEQECIPNFQLPGESNNTPTCESPETCIAAECADPYVPPWELGPYYASWAEGFSDECKPAEPGPAEIAIGEGRESFEAMSEGGVMQLGAGFQGGYHVWVAARAKNLHRAGTVTLVEGGVVSPAATFASVEVAYGYAPTEGGACDIVGIRFEVPEEFWVDVTPLLGASVDLRVKVVDVAGDAAFDECRIQISDDFVKDVTD